MSKFSALKKVLGNQAERFKTKEGLGELAIGAGLGLGGSAAAFGAYQASRPDNFVSELMSEGGEVVDSIGNYLEDNPEYLLNTLGLAGGQALGTFLEKRNARKNYEQERKEMRGR